MRWLRLLRRGALCALLLLVARLLASLLLGSDLQTLQFFRAVRGQSIAFDADSCAVPVLASVSPGMSADPSADGADGRSVAASLSFARQMATSTGNLAAALRICHPLVSP